MLTKSHRIVKRYQIILNNRKIFSSVGLKEQSLNIFIYEQLYMNVAKEH